MSAKRRVVVCAAIRNNAGHIICGPRHWDDTMRAQVISSREDWSKAEQGFIDQLGVLMTREEAWAVAEVAGQIKYRVGGDGERLYSENLY